MNLNCLKMKTKKEKIMSETKPTKGESIDMHEKQLKSFEQQLINLQGFSQHVQQGITMLMQSVDGLKMMMNAQLSVMCDVFAQRLEISREQADQMLETAFQVQADKYRKELEEAMKKHQEIDAAMAAAMPANDEEATPANIETADTGELASLLSL